MNTLLAAPCSFLLACCLVTPIVGQDRSRHPYAMEYGPVISGTWEAQWPKNNFALKGLAIRVGGEESASQVIFDTELLRVSAMAMNHYQELRGTAYDGAHGPGLKIGGRQFLATRNGPGWALGGSFTDPRPIPHGPLPKKWARYKGLYLYGNQVVVNYRVGDCDVLESFDVEGAGANRVLNRVMDLGPSSAAMQMNVGMRRGASAAVIGNVAVLRYEIAATGLVSMERGSMSWDELDMGPPTGDDYADIKSAHGVETRVVLGSAKVNKRAGAVDGVLPRLHDGAAARHWDDRVRIVWFDGRGEARMVTDLKQPINIVQINTYSWHRGNRAAQVYELFGSDAEVAPDTMAKKPAESGWQSIIRVNSRSLGSGGIHGVRIAHDTAALGRYRYLLWVSRSTSTFFTELDIFESGHRPPASKRPRRGSFVTAVGLVGAPVGAEFQVSGDEIRLHLPPRSGRQQIKLVFFDGPARALKSFRARVAKSRPARPLAGAIRGGPSRWGAATRTKGRLGSGEGAYVVDRLVVPTDQAAGSHLRFGGFDFFPDGRAALSTWNGDVWILSGIDAGLANLRWKRFATGLFDPLGLKIVGGVIHTLGRDGITRLHDLNGDGEADHYECFNNDVLMTKSFHEFAFDLQTDPQGNFYFAKAGPVRPGGRGFDPLVPHHGCVLKVSKDGSKLEVFATGLRAPNGIGVGPNGEVTSGDNEGTWVPACRLNWMKQGTFNGCVDTAHLPTRPKMYDPPLCFMPMRVDNSGGGQVWVTTDKWGPFKGDLLHLSYGKSTLFKAMHEEVDGVTQGGVTPFKLKFTSSCMRARFHPKTGQLFICGFRGWQTNAVQMTGLDRVRYTGKPVRMLSGLRTTTAGVYLTFTCGLHRASAEDPESYEVEAWNYLWTRKYGSPEVSTVDFDPNAKKGAKPKHDSWRVMSASLLGDGKTVFLALPDIKPVMQMWIKFDIDANDGGRIKSELHSSIHKLGK